MVLGSANIFTNKVQQQKTKWRSTDYNDYKQLLNVIVTFLSPL